MVGFGLVVVENKKSGLIVDIGGWGIEYLGEVDLGVCSGLLANSGDKHL